MVIMNEIKISRNDVKYDFLDSLFLKLILW